MAKKEDLKWFKMVMFDMFGNKKELDFVMPSEESARKKWHKKYNNSSWRLDYIVQIDKVDGHKIFFSK